MFEIGTRVRTGAQRRHGHTRLPRYLQHRRGRVVGVLGQYRFADEAADRGLHADTQVLYTVEFENEGYAVCADLFESYLEPDA